MLKQLRPAIVLLFAFTILTGLVYPFAITGLAQTLFPHQAQGSLITRDGKVIGSELIGQNFTDPKYFHGRPSATTDTDPNDSTKTVPAPYNADNSGGLELRSDLAGADRPGQDRYGGAQDGEGRPRAGRSGDHIGQRPRPGHYPAAAEFQVDRVAKERGLPADKVRALVVANTEGRSLFGPDRRAAGQCAEAQPRPGRGRQVAATNRPSRWRRKPQSGMMHDAVAPEVVESTAWGAACFVLSERGPAVLPDAVPEFWELMDPCAFCVLYPRTPRSASCGRPVRRGHLFGDPQHRLDHPVLQSGPELHHRFPRRRAGRTALPGDGGHRQAARGVLVPRIG